MSATAPPAPTLNGTTTASPTDDEIERRFKRHPTFAGIYRAYRAVKSGQASELAPVTSIAHVSESCAQDALYLLELLGLLDYEPARLARWLPRAEPKP